MLDPPQTDPGQGIESREPPAPRPGGRSRWFRLPRLSRRRWTQIVSAVAVNLYLPAFLAGVIVQARSKGICVPVLNCYSCPAAVAACPIGSMQHMMAGARARWNLGDLRPGLYVLGSIGVVGALVGRFPCGWLCPFGLFQELAHKIPGAKLAVPRVLGYLKYAVTALLVFILPFFVLDAFGYGDTWFCKWICPAGTLEAGLPLVAANAGIRAQIGWLFAWKVAVLVLFFVWMILSMRPFCRTMCPLGAILGLFNKVSLLRLSVDSGECTACGRCVAACPVDLDVRTHPNSPDCIRCFKCVKACDADCIRYEFGPWPPIGSSRPGDARAEESSGP